MDELYPQMCECRCTDGTDFASCMACTGNDTLLLPKGHLSQQVGCLYTNMDFIREDINNFAVANSYIKQPKQHTLTYLLKYILPNVLPLPLLAAKTTKKVFHKLIRLCNEE